MPETQTEDEVVSSRTAAVGPVARPTIHETIDSGGTTKTAKVAGVEEDETREGGGTGRKFKESTIKLLDALEAKPEGDTDDEADPDDAGTEADGSTDAAADPDDTDDADATGDGDTEGESGEAGEGKEAPPAVNEWEARATRTEAANVRLTAELEAARKTPKSDRTPHETELVDAYDSYVNEGSVPALRKFLGAVIGAAPDSKDVSAELAGLYADLTAQELGVPLEQSTQALREAARARLALARDKRERKTESDKKAEPVNVDEAQQIANAVPYVDNLLVTKGQSGTSIADEFPLLMSLAEHFDGMKPAEVIARAVKREITTGALDPNVTEGVAVRTVARKIEAYYDGLATKIEKARASKQKPDTTKTGEKKPSPAATVKSQEQRQSTGARTITNATASVAPATPPPKKKAVATTEKTRRDFKNDREWREHLLTKHIPQ